MLKIAALFCPIYYYCNSNGNNNNTNNKTLTAKILITTIMIVVIRIIKSESNTIELNTQASRHLCVICRYKVQRIFN